ncbi:DNA helicase [Palaeococcus pacificus DY20341]|uniref:DNA helicase n=1 Tax=Palaeococcus pacificus DY20341 TaxID=1343739 RepID=A0A075LUX5_9EURY|nr:ATP-binding protein [Palaeococcus pacificus]AIF69936.1 DNA helicase [Palaeococcus pacificus DY20341]
MEDKVGIVYGESSTDYFTFIVDPKNMPNFGEFVVVKNRNGEEVLAVVKSVKNINWLMSAGRGSYDYIEKTVTIFSKGVLDKSESIIASAKVLGVLKTKEDIESGDFEFRQIPNRVPIKPGEVVKLADNDDLKKIFSNGHIRIGRLLARADVEVGLDVDRLVSRHFAVLAVTGAGKSNTIAVLTKEIIDKTRGTIVILDPHGEYSSLTWKNARVNPIKATIDPSKITISEFATLLGIAENASLQRRFLSLAYHTVKWEAKNQAKVLGGLSFVEALEDQIEEWIRTYENKSKGEEAFIDYYDSQGRVLQRKIQARDLDSLIRIKDYLQELKANFGEFIKLGNVLSEIVPGMANIIDLSGMEEDQMIALASYLLRGVLKYRVQYMKALRTNDAATLKMIREKFPALTKPLLLVIEEAHIFAPRGEKTQASHWLGKIAREGRKFGIGLGIVSQRPKKLDDDILSQTNTKIILRLVEPHDQKYVQQASEQISEDLLMDIASLGIGEAVIVGYAISLPAMVKIYSFKDEFKGYYGGGDIDIVKEWSEGEEREDFDLADFAGE